MKNIQTPAYILKKEVLENSILSFEKALSSFFPRYILSYSLKTNSFPYILKTIRRFGGYAEVVSYDEYELAKLCGFAINEIVYNGPLKSKETFLEAIQGGAIVNIETKKELLWLKELPKDKKFGIGLRINIDLAEISSKDAKKDEDFSRFGFSEGSGELKFAIEQICELPNIILEGMHVHRTTASRSLEAYKGIAKFVGGIINKYNLSVAYIDMGGGYYGIMDNKPNFHEYCEIMYEGLRTTIDIDKITLVVEPGNAIVASAFDFVSEVIDVKKVRDFYIATTDGSRNDLDRSLSTRPLINTTFPL